jgi:hypothetical protein
MMGSEKIIRKEILTSPVSWTHVESAVQHTKKGRRKRAIAKRKNLTEGDGDMNLHFFELHFD